MTTAPASHPWDVELVLAGALDVLRLEADDPDADRVASCVLAATDLIDQWLDYAEPLLDLPADLEVAAVNVTVELFRRKDAPFGVTDSWSVDGAVVRISSDPLRGSRALLRPFKSRRGVA
jgi:hypothetical protein